VVLGAAMQTTEISRRFNPRPVRCHAATLGEGQRQDITSAGSRGQNPRWGSVHPLMLKVL